MAGGVISVNFFFTYPYHEFNVTMYGYPLTFIVFLTVALFAHGYASIIANNALKYDEALIAGHLEQAWIGAVLAATEEET